MSAEKTRILPKDCTPEEWRWYVVTVCQAAANELIASRVTPTDESVKNLILEKRKNLPNWQRLMTAAAKIREKDIQMLSYRGAIDKYRKIDTQETLNLSFMDEILLDSFIASQR